MYCVFVQKVFFLKSGKKSSWSRHFYKTLKGARRAVSRFRLRSDVLQAFIE